MLDVFLLGVHIFQRPPSVLALRSSLDGVPFCILRKETYASFHKALSTVNKTSRSSSEVAEGSDVFKLKMFSCCQ